MRFCDADACTCCSLADQPKMAPCLRQKAKFCMWLATTQGPKMRAMLEELSLALMAEASALELETSIPPTPTE